MMKLRPVIYLLLVSAVSVAVVSLAYGQNKYKLKPGASGKLCLSCHPDFEEKLSAR